MERAWKPNVEISPTCPRCGSSNTKFCYYNYYSLTQPRYLCKGCRRYWTKGGSLRSVLVGGGCRKSLRGKSTCILTDRLPSRSCLAYGGAPAPGHNSNALVDQSTSSTMVSDGPNIDLALVYANFLNKKPEPETLLKMPELCSARDFRHYDFVSPVTNMHMGFNTHLPLDNGIAECPTLCGFSSIHKQQETIQQLTSNHTSNVGLPPLPGDQEAIASQEMAWSNPPFMFSNHMLHATQLPEIESEPEPEPEPEHN